MSGRDDGAIKRVARAVDALRSERAKLVERIRRIDVALGGERKPVRGRGRPQSPAFAAIMRTLTEKPGSTCGEVRALLPAEMNPRSTLWNMKARGILRVESGANGLCYFIAAASKPKESAE